MVSKLFRIKLISIGLLYYVNPAVQTVVDVLCLCMLSSDLSSDLGELASVRAELLTYLTHVLMGDSLAAEYLILHLISNVYVSF